MDSPGAATHIALWALNQEAVLNIRYFVLLTYEGRMPLGQPIRGLLRPQTFPAMMTTLEDYDGEFLLAFIQEAVLNIVVRFLILFPDAGQVPLAQPIGDLWGLQAVPHGWKVPTAPAQQHDSPQRARYQVQQCWLALQSSQHTLSL